MKLSSPPQALGIEGWKGYFSHFFNTAENWIYVGPLPPLEYYGVDSMMLEEKKHFSPWHTASQDIFDLQNQLSYYCQQGVKAFEIIQE